MDGAVGRYSSLYTLMSVFALAVMLRVVSGDALATVFVNAVFATVSLPVVYSMAYISTKVSGEGRFVKKKPGEGLRERLAPEGAALLVSYAMGFMAFYALTGYFDLLLYTLAYTAAQAMRALDSLAINAYDRVGADPGNPLLVLLAAFGSAAVALLALLPFLRLVY